MSHHRTVHALSLSHGQAIRKSHSEECLPCSQSVENLDFRGSSVAIKTIPSFSKLGKQLRIRFESKDQIETKESNEGYSGEQEKRNKRWKFRTERDSQEFESKPTDSLHCTVNSEPGVQVKMSLVQTTSPVNTVSDLREAQETIKKLNESLLNEKRLSEAKDTTIGNLRHEINLLDQELVDRRKENDKINEETRKLRSKTTALQTENKILERQVSMMNESNKKLHNELHELRNKLRIQETKVGELRVQRSEAVRKYAHLLQTSVDKSTRLRYFLQQLQNEILAHSVTSKKFQMQKQALEDLMQEDSEEDLQFKRYGLISPRKIRKTSYLLSEEEKESLRKDLENAFESRQNKVQDTRSLLVEKLTTATERILTEGLRSRLGQENEESLQMSKLMQEAKHQIKGLEKIQSSHVEESKRLEDKVGTQLKTLEAELKDLSDELRLAQISKREDEEKLRSIRKFSSADIKVESISLARRASQVEKLDLESAINSMERRSEDPTSPVSPMESEILSMKQKLAALLEEKLMLSDELIESRTSLSNLENLLESRSLENEKMEKELTEKEKRILLTEEQVKEAQKEMANLKEELETAKNELLSREREGIAQPEGKVKDRPHRVELNFTPSLQPVLEQKVENLKEELVTVRRNSVTQLNRMPAVAPLRVDKGIQVDGSEQRKLVRMRSFESLRTARRRLSLDLTCGYGNKIERKISKTEVRLVQRVEKGIQVDIDKAELGTTPDHSTKDEASTANLTKENRELKTIMEQQGREIASLENEIKKLRDNQEASYSADNVPFTPPLRLSELWRSLEEARQEKAEAEKRNKELQNKLEQQEQEIQVILENFKHQKDEHVLNIPNEVINSNYFKEDHNMTTEQGRSLEELVREGKTNCVSHEFVVDTEDGRDVSNELPLEAASRNEQNISMQESVIDRMKKDLTASEEQGRELETELYRKEDDLRRAEREIELYKTKLSEMKDFLEKTSREKDCVDREAVQYKTQVSDLNRALLLETRKEKLRAEEDVQQHKSQIAELSASLDRTRTEKGHLENDIELFKSQTSELKSSLEKAKRENEKSFKEIIHCNSQIEHLENSLEEARTEFQTAKRESDRYKSETLQLKTLLDEIRMEKQKATENNQSRISELRTSLDDSEKGLNSAKKEIEQQKSEMFELKSQLKKTQKENRKAVDEREQYKSEISILEASLEKTRKGKVDAEVEIRKKEFEILDLKSSLDERLKETERVSSDVKRQKYQMEELKASLEDAKKENSWNVKEINRYKDEISELRVLLDRSRKESSNVSKEYELYMSEISDLQASLDEERKENRANKATVENYKSELSDLRNSLEKAKEEKRTATIDIERYKGQITDYQESLKGERKEKLVAENKIKEGELEISDLKKHLDKAKQENHNLQSDIERYKTQISELQASLEEEKKENLAAAKEIIKYESEISDLKNSFEKTKEETFTAATNNIESHETQILDEQTALEDTKREKRRRKSQTIQLQSEISKREGTMQEYKIKEAEARLEKERLETSNSKLQITIANLKNQLMAADEKVKGLENRGEEDSRTISQLMDEQSGMGHLQEQIKVLETKLNVRDKNLEQKVEEIIERDRRIEQLAWDIEDLQRKIQENRSKSEENSVDLGTVDGETVVKVEAESLPESSPEIIDDPEIIEDLGNEVVEFKEQLQILQTALREIQQEKAYLEDTVQDLTRVKNSQEKELGILRQQIQFLESSVQDTAKTVEENAIQMGEKEKELRELVNEKVEKTSQIESLETSLSTTLRERDSTLAGKLINSDFTVQILKAGHLGEN